MYVVENRSWDICMTRHKQHHPERYKWSHFVAICLSGHCVCKCSGIWYNIIDMMFNWLDDLDWVIDLWTSQVTNYNSKWTFIAPDLCKHTDSKVQQSSTVINESLSKTTNQTTDEPPSQLTNETPAIWKTMRCHSIFQTASFVYSLQIPEHFLTWQHATQCSLVLTICLLYSKSSFVTVYLLMDNMEWFPMNHTLHGLYVLPP